MSDPRSQSRYEAARDQLRSRPRRWLVTGAAGFIGSNLVEELLRLDQQVVGLDNFTTGHAANLDQVREAVGEKAERFSFIEGDIADAGTCRSACREVDFVLHQAALGSVPRSIKDPLATHEANVTGFLNMLVGAKEAGVARFVYASSSSVYGDHPELPKVEGREGTPLSPYAVTKKTDELYAAAFHLNYGLPVVGLRYFNVFGRRQDPNGPYAAVIPKWISQMLAGEQVVIYGDGETSRDFTYVADVVQANILSAAGGDGAGGHVVNVASGGRVMLNELYGLLREGLIRLDPELRIAGPAHLDFRPGDVRHSQADISKARNLLGYAPEFTAHTGLEEVMPWYVSRAHEWH